MPQAGKRQLNVTLTVEAYDGWKRFAEVNGMTMAATIEAIGAAFAATGRLPAQREVTREARRIDAERRDRRTGR